MPVNREDIENLVGAVPGFRKSFQMFLQEWEPKGSLPWYLAMGELAHYVVESYGRGITEEFADLFATVESLLNKSEPELENLIAVGLFEDIQNVASHREFGAHPFRRWLGPRSLIVWNEVDVFTQRVAVWTAQQKPRWWQFWRHRSGFDSTKALAQVESPELRKVIEAQYRKKE
jgi:NTP pyrophosphatase (non-canonical NTP hydrolase)